MVSNNGLASTSHWKACKVRLADMAQKQAIERRLLGAQPMTHDEIVELISKGTEQ